MDITKHLKLFGTKIIVLNKPHHKKFLPKGIEMLMIGYSEQSKAYRLYDPISRTVQVSWDVIFVEGKYGESENKVNVSNSINFGDFLNLGNSKTVR